MADKPKKQQHQQQEVTQSAETMHYDRQEKTGLREEHRCEA